MWVFSIICFAYVTNGPSLGQMTQGEIWPLPQKVVYGSVPRIIGKNSIDIVYEATEHCDIIDSIRKVYCK